MGLPSVHTRALTLRVGRSGHSALRFLTLLVLHHSASRREFPIGLSVYHVIMALRASSKSQQGRVSRTLLSWLNPAAAPHWQPAPCLSEPRTPTARRSPSWVFAWPLHCGVIGSSALFHGSPRLGFCLLVRGLLGNVTSLQTRELFPCCTSCRKWLPFCG